MSRKQLTLALVIGFVTAICIGLLMGILASRAISNTTYNHTAYLVGSVYSQHPDLEESLIQGLNHPKTERSQLGDEILNKYGYTQRLFFGENLWASITHSLWVWGLLFLLFTVTLCGFTRKKRVRIHELTNYLSSINRRQEGVMHRVQEDEFSLLEDEMYKTVVELRQTRETALKERQSLADNLADIAHQLKTPITSVFLMTELLLDSNRDREELLYVEKIHGQMTRLEHLVSTLLTLSRLDAGTLEMRQEPINVFEMLTSASEPLEKVIGQKRQTLILQSEPTLFYCGDWYWSVEALINLIKNCSEHTPEGGAISLSYEQNPIFTKIVVEDSGEGFVMEDIPRLFERFYKGRNAHKNSVGIGLAMAKSIIDKQKGTIRAENRPEGGARFIVKMYTR
ncbi:sensor histidine kinase [Paenibacillus wynnii]|uniref:histidine kinase n=1 Tax=Paenibacillus wynnii TaxID=268407 RepID=A0A098M569_9BACL|nr:HAMP domain-containing sensor histidine kinase [Paenibacillus wynnii]KGE17695.1 hypothetical protein PWYN_24295 [Paenibacillus wynnii]